MAGLATPSLCLVGVAVTQILEPETHWGSAAGGWGSAWKIRESLQPRRAASNSYNS